MAPLIPTPPAWDDERDAKLKRRVRDCQPLKDSPAAEFIESRGIPTELAQTAGIKYHETWPFEIDDNWANLPAVVFPVRGEGGKLVAAQGRRLDTKGFTTLGNRLWGVFSTRTAIAVDTLTIAEGPLDALSLELAGMPAVALTGSAGVPIWLRKHAARHVMRDGIAYNRAVVIATDSDEAGIAASLAIRADLGPTGARIVRFLGFLKDWNDVLTQEGVSELCNLIDKLCDENGLPIPVLPDPRPERRDDSGLWIRLLRMTEDMEDLNGALRGFRAYGADLHVFDRRAVITLNEEDSGWTSQEEFDTDYDRYIRPHADTLMSIPM